jgi:puromycin-sensitive aminopeptidase
VVNAGAHAFARVRYDEELLGRIAASLDNLSTDERTQLVDDTWAAVVAGRTSAAEFCRFAGAFRNEVELTVWSSLLEGIRWCDRLLDAGPREHYRAWVRSLVGPALERIGWEPREGERDLTRSLRGTLMTAIAILGADPNAQALAREVELRARADGDEEPSLTAASIVIVASGGGPTEYDAYLKARTTARTPQERLRYLYALADFRDAVLFERTLDLSLTEEIRPQETPWVLTRAMSNREQGPIAWRFVKERWRDIVSRVAPSNVVFVVDALPYLATPELVDEASAFFLEHPIPQSALQLQQLLERQRVNADLRRRAVPELQSFFSAPPQ